MRIQLTICLSFFLFTSLFTGAQEQDPAGQIKALMESCQFSQAIDLAELHLTADSTRADLLLLRARALSAGFRYREAIADLQKALANDSTNKMVLNELVNVFRQSGMPGKAIEASREICRLEPGNRYFLLQLANLYFSEEDYRAAISLFRSMYATDSSYYISRQLGNCYNETKQHDSAILFYRQALRSIPYDPFVTGKMVNVLIRINDIAMALYWTQMFLQQQDSANVPILKQNGYCYYLLMDFRTAAKQFHECRRLGDSSKFTMKYLGLCYYKQEAYDSAVPCFREAFLSDTTDPEVCFYYGVSAYRAGRADTGLAYLEQTYRLLMPSDQFLSSLLVELAGAYNDKERPDTALVLFRKALELNPVNNVLRFKIAYQYDFHLRRPFDALPWYREFLRKAEPVADDDIKLPQHLSYSDYAKNRIREISGKQH
jgi:tetratricopeptide (TPR) repeat protein